ncbi:MAG: AI-2E family transporter, partial [Pontibacter sp.]|nr:AI-2E family transporter [Pontibacter sp.]
MGRRLRKLQLLTFTLLFGILLVFILVEAREFLYPIFMAVLFSYLLYPVEKKMETWGLPRILANFITVIMAMGVLAGVLILLYKQLSVFIDDFPALQDKALNNLDRLQRRIDVRFGDTNPENKHWLSCQVSNALELS